MYCDPAGEAVGLKIVFLFGFVHGAGIAPAESRADVGRDFKIAAEIEIEVIHALNVVHRVPHTPIAERRVQDQAIRKRKLFTEREPEKPGQVNVPKNLERPAAVDNVRSFFTHAVFGFTLRLSIVGSKSPVPPFERGDDLAIDALAASAAGELLSL